MSYRLNQLLFSLQIFLQEGILDKIWLFRQGYWQTFSQELMKYAFHLKKTSQYLLPRLKFKLSSKNLKFCKRVQYPAQLGKGRASYKFKVFHMTVLVILANVSFTLYHKKYQHLEILCHSQETSIPI